MISTLLSIALGVMEVIFSSFYCRKLLGFCIYTNNASLSPASQNTDLKKTANPSN